MRINSSIGDVLICPFCQKTLEVAGYTNCPKCGQPLFVDVSVKPAGTAIVPIRPMDYIQNPKEENNE